MSTTQEFKSLEWFERKEYEELKSKNMDTSQVKNERIVFLGYFAIALISTLLISGAL
jgi:hypothetical protein